MRMLQALHLMSANRDTHIYLTRGMPTFASIVRRTKHPSVVAATIRIVRRLVNAHGGCDSVLDALCDRVSYSNSDPLNDMPISCLQVLVETTLGCDNARAGSTLEKVVRLASHMLLLGTAGTKKAAIRILESGVNRRIELAVQPSVVCHLLVGFCTETSLPQLGREYALIKRLMAHDEVGRVREGVLLTPNRPARGDVCCICLERMQDESLSCRHQFCQACLKAHIDSCLTSETLKYPQCPLCRADLSNTDVLRML